MLKWIKNIFTGKDKLVKSYKSFFVTRHHRPATDSKFIWALVGNIVAESPSGQADSGKTGTKYFSANAKLCCFPPAWGDGYERIKVIGRHRKSKRFITLIIPAAQVTNWRLQKVYNPYIINEMYSRKGWTDSEDDQKLIQEMVHWLSLRTHNPRNQK